MPRSARDPRRRPHAPWTPPRIRPSRPAAATPGKLSRRCWSRTIFWKPSSPSSGPRCRKGMRAGGCRRCEEERRVQRSEVTYYVALPFVLSDDGVVAAEAIECFNPNAAVMKGDTPRGRKWFAHRAFPGTGFPATISNRRASPSVCNSAVAPTTVRLGRSVPMPGSIVRAPHGSWFAIQVVRYLTEFPAGSDDLSAQARQITAARQAQAGFRHIRGFNR